MKQEDKKLLLKDLSARLPYGVYCQIDDEEQPMLLYSVSGNTIGFVKNIAAMMVRSVTINRIKPYLRPLSSMTDAEKEYYYLTISMSMYASNACELIDWLNKNHFDYRGLISKNLAIEAPSDMYKFE